MECISIYFELADFQNYQFDSSWNHMEAELSSNPAAMEASLHLHAGCESPTVNHRCHLHSGCIIHHPGPE